VSISVWRKVNHFMDYRMIYLYDWLMLVIYALDPSFEI